MINRPGWRASTSRMLHSVGRQVDLLAVRPTPAVPPGPPGSPASPPPAPRPPADAAAQGGAQPGQQLVHAERLGQVVVGAEVERGHLVGLRLPDREHDDRHRRPSPQAADDVEPVDAGQPEVQEHDVGMAGRRQVQRLLARCRLVDVVAARLEVDGQGAADLRLVVHHQHPPAHSPDPSHAAARRDGDGEATARRVVDADVALHRGDEAVGHRQPEADAGVVRAVAEAAGRARTPGPAEPAGMPGPRSMTRRQTRPCTGAASMRTGCSSGDQASALDTTLATARSSRAGSASTRGTVSGTSTSSCRPLTLSPLNAAATMSSRATAAQLQLQRAALQPAHVEEVGDDAVETIGGRVDGGRAGRRGRPPTTPRRCWSRLVTAALIDASGVRRSWDTACSRARRSASVSTSASASSASSRSSRLSSASRSWSAKARSTSWSAAPS